MAKQIIGNECLFCLYKFVNIFLVLMGLLVLAMGIFLFVQIGKANATDMLFIILGLLEVILAIIGFSSRKSIAKLNIYIFFMGFIFLGQLLVTVLGIVNKDKLIKEAKKYLPDKDAKIIEQNIDIVLYSTFGAVVVELLGFLIGYCYKNSLQYAKDENKRYLFEDDEGRKISLQEKTDESRKKNEAEALEKRLNYEAKYGISFDDHKKKKR